MARGNNCIYYSISAIPPQEGVELGCLCARRVQAELNIRQREKGVKRNRTVTGYEVSMGGAGPQAASAYRSAGVPARFFKRSNTARATCRV